MIEAAARCRLFGFRERGLALLRKTPGFSPPLLNALCILDRKREYIDIMIDRLDNPPNWEIQQWLTMLTVKASGYGSSGEFPRYEAAQLKQRWRRWFAENGDVWRKTGRLPLSDARLGPRPLARGQHISSR